MGIRAVDTYPTRFVGRREREWWTSAKPMGRGVMRLTAEAHQLESFDGLGLRLLHWKGMNAARGSCLLCTGRNESIERYNETAEKLVARGFDVWGMDWRGQGGSQREITKVQLGHVRCFEDYLGDLRTVLAKIFQGRCTLLVGHSMGAHLAIRYLHDQPDAADAMILSAPMIELAGGGRFTEAVGFIARAAGRLGLAQHALPGHRDLHRRARRFRGNVLTSDPERFARNYRFLDDHPELITGGATYGWLAEAARSMRRALAPGFPEKISIPVLILSPKADRVVSTRAHRNYAMRLPAAELVEIPGARHELFQETNAVLAIVWRSVDRFLDACTG